MQKDALQKFKKYLIDHKTSSKELHTHRYFKVDNFPGKFYIDDNEYYEFIKKYYLPVTFDTSVHLMECQPEYSNILVDIDIKTKEKIEFNKTEDICKILATIVKSITNKQFTIWILEKKSKNVKIIKNNTEYYKNGIHIQIPELTFNLETRKYIITRLSNICKENNIFNYSSLIDNNIIDTAACINSWLMYGSCKPNNDFYVVRKIYDNNMNPKDTKNISILECIIKLSVRINKYKEKVIYNTISDMPKKSISNNNKTIQKFICKTTKSNDNEVALAKELIKILDKSRADDYNDWIRIGWILHNINNEKLLETYKEFSMQSDKYEEGCCEKVFATARKSYNLEKCSNLYTIATLKWLAKKDNPDEYNKIIRKNNNECLKVLELSDTNIANIIKIFLDNTVKRCNDKWYIYDNNKWKIYDNKDTYKVRDKILDIEPKIIDMIEFYKRSHTETENDSNKEYTNHIIRNLTILLEKIKNRRSRNVLISELGDCLIDENLANKIDSNPYLIGFENGVYDLLTGTFRESTQDDYISKSVGYDYMEVDKESEEYKCLLEFIENIYPIERVRHYMLKFFASLLDGVQRNQKFHILIGAGSNGKSTLINLLQATLGDYYMPAKVEMFTRKRSSTDSGAASPEILMLRNVRAACMQEIDSNEKLYTGKLKELTGGDTIVARALYSNNMERIKLQCKFFLVCNNLPQIDTLDEGTWRRIVVVDHETQFVDKDKVQYSYQRPKNTDLINRVKHWYMEFMSLLLDYYKIYREEGLDMPSHIYERTLKYKNQCNIFKEFIYERYENTDDRNVFVPMNEFTSDINVWLRDIKHSKRIIKLDEVEAYFRTSDYRIDDINIYGLKRKSNNTEIDI